MCKNAEEINYKLLKAQTEWQDKCYGALFEEYKNNEEARGKLSCAFGFGVSEHYVLSDKKIMIVGQEANGHTYDYEKWDLKHWREWAVDYLNFQVYDEKPNGRSFTKNKSPFWQFFKILKNQGYGVCWNNLDKVRRYVKEDGKEWKENYLPYDKDNAERQILNRKIFGEGKSLLEKEIEIAKPDIIVFAVGPSNPYYHTLYSAFLGSSFTYDQILNKCPYPTAKEECLNVQGVLNLPVSAFYTYHPNYLKQSKKFEKVIEQITGKKI